MDGLIDDDDCDGDCDAVTERRSSTLCLTSLSVVAVSVTGTRHGVSPVRTPVALRHLVLGQQLVQVTA